MIDVVFDTTVLVDHLRNHRPATELMKKVASGEVHGKISSLTVLELFAGNGSSKKEERGKIGRLLDLFDIVPVDGPIAISAGDIRRECGTEVPDSIISATAMGSGSMLLTSNLKDFEGIPGLTVKAPY